MCVSGVVDVELYSKCKHKRQLSVCIALCHLFFFILFIMNVRLRPVLAVLALAALAFVLFGLDMRFGLVLFRLDTLFTLNARDMICL